ncbi:hypothetical protein E2C01_051912 [Portunus trituberculatus]|uniref:Uncharacterized protein n=1 Tax=Portunus trituberculatus TaxID=210409 RepID=A0A5B7GC95_PORTR|nr:hypothetical protein [Portunus trituberculatus]
MASQAVNSVRRSQVKERAPEVQEAPRSRVTLAALRIKVRPHKGSAPDHLCCARGRGGSRLRTSCGTGRSDWTREPLSARNFLRGRSLGSVQPMKTRQSTMLGGAKLTTLLSPLNDLLPPCSACSLLPAGATAAASPTGPPADENRCPM